MRKNIVLGLVFLSMANLAYSQLPKTAKAGIPYFRLSSNVTEKDYLPKTVIVKVKKEHKDLFAGKSDSRVEAVLSEIGASVPERKFPGATVPEAEKNRFGQKLVDLTRIYSFSYAAERGIEPVINSLLATGFFEYAEPHYVPRLYYNPNDPYSTSTGQYHLGRIKAYQAWDISKGDTNVVIGITDTGVEPNHPDLKDNIKRNYSDPIDGIDNDMDGYVDNFSGWDLGENDNNPTWQANAHGVHVSGLAAATTDNSTGVAGVGFKCKFLPIKISNAAGSLVRSYEGITYAADHGCAVVNCSWGGPGGGQFGQDVIDYATNNKNCLVIAASGNDGADIEHFPSSYASVLSVASTTSSDKKSSFSNYGYGIDVCAPGSNDLSTYSNNSYNYSSGTSMASPVAAGAAAIVKSHFPGYNAMQVGQRLKVTCDDIYGISDNYNYANKLGRGRINLYNALTGPGSPSIEILSRAETDKNDETFLADDTLRITGDFINYLEPTTNLTATLVASSPFVQVLDGTTNLGVVATMQVKDNKADPFLVKIRSTAPVNAKIPFKITFTDGAYTEVRYFNIIVNVDFINIAINDVSTTVTSKGKVGYNQDNQLQGLGFRYKGGGSTLYEGGLMIGTSSGAVSDVVRGTSGTSADYDFQSFSRASKILPSVKSEFDVAGAFTDNTSTTPLNIGVTHAAYAWTSPADRKYVIVEYRIRNNGTSALNNLYAGLFADWDILEYEKNKAGFDSTNRMGYAYSTDSSLYAGVKLLSRTASVNHYAIDNVAGGGGGIDISGGFATDQKYTVLSSSRPTAGGTGTGNDVCDVVSSGPFSIPAGDSVTVAFALIAGDSLGDIKQSAASAQIKYDGLITAVGKGRPVYGSGFSLFPNPAGEELTIRLTIEETAEAEVKIFDVSGRLVYTQHLGRLGKGINKASLNVSGLESGVYFSALSIDGNASDLKKLVISR